MTEVQFNSEMENAYQEMLDNKGVSVQQAFSSIKRSEQLNYRVRVLPLAIEDLQEIYNYIAFELQSVINAENQLSRLQDEIQKLDFMPESFKLYEKEPWKSRGLRYFSVDNYIVFEFLPETYWGMTREDVVKAHSFLEEIKWY